MLVFILLYLNHLKALRKRHGRRRRRGCCCARVRQVSELAYELTCVASAFAGQVPEENRLLLAELVRLMNCHYSNLIEGNHPHPRDIDTAMTKDYSLLPEKWNLQLEAAHIHLQGCIDERRAPDLEPASAEYARWLHREFCSHLPEELLVVENPKTRERKRVVPGEFRDGGVAVGKHEPPRADEPMMPGSRLVGAMWRRSG